MADKLCFIACIVILFFGAASGKNESVEKLMRHIERMDAKIDVDRENARTREAGLITKMEAIEKRVGDLEETNMAILKENDRLRTTMDKLSQNIGTNPNEAPPVANQTDNTDTGNPRSSTIRTENADLCETKNIKTKRALQDGNKIAFSAYMDHDTNNLAIGQPLVYNQVLLNDGNAYNHHTGTFTAPIAGVYSFTFFIGQRDSDQIIVGLYVNSENKVDAIAQTDKLHDDVEGGNSVVLNVSVGDAVFVKNIAGSHVEGGSQLRLTTFSGFMLYPTEGDTLSVVGK